MHIVFLFMLKGSANLIICSHSPPGISWVRRVKGTGSCVNLTLFMKYPLVTLGNSQCMVLCITTTSANPNVSPILPAYLFLPLECTKIFITSIKRPVTGLQLQILFAFYFTILYLDIYMSVRDEA
jgi:hypothetical protein